MDTTSLDVDGLFADDVLGDPPFEVPLVGDNTGLLPTQSLVPAGLVQHMEDLRHCGSCQRIAWSKQGCIATVSPDSLHIDIKYLRFSKKVGFWNLSEAYPLFQDDYAFHISYIQWSPTGVDLAVADVAGRVSIFSHSHMAANRLYEVRPASLDTPDELGQPVALFWLNQDRQVS